MRPVQIARFAQPPWTKRMVKNTARTPSSHRARSRCREVPIEIHAQELASGRRIPEGHHRDDEDPDGIARAASAA